MMYEIRSVSGSANRRVIMLRSVWRRLASTFADSNLGAVVVFCVIGLLATINLILRFPDASTLIMEYNLF